jgi:hypothetical protein
VIVELRSVADCPNLDTVRDALAAALADLGGQATVIEQVGDYPSPSVLINGLDVMGAAAGATAACRLVLPTSEDIRAALREAIAVRENQVPDPRAVRPERSDRAARLPHPLRQMHVAILRHFAATGSAPTSAEINSTARAAGLDPAAALHALAADDLIAIDTAGRLLAAYPFSPAPTPHRVSLPTTSVHAMCAIDALGMPFMLDSDAVITSTDPHTGEPVQVTVTGGKVRFQPPDAVVVHAATPATGRSVDTRCSTINFFAGTGSARAWIANHPGLAATILTQDEAVRLGRDIFESLLHQP